MSQTFVRIAKDSGSFQSICRAGLSPCVSPPPTRSMCKSVHDLGRVVQSGQSSSVQRHPEAARPDFTPVRRLFLSSDRWLHEQVPNDADVLGLKTIATHSHPMHSPCLATC